MANILGWIVKIATVCSTGLLVAQIVFAFIFSFSLRNFVAALYTGIPCVALILIEFNVLESFTKYFGFLAPLIGRAIFMILVGLTFYEFSFPNVLWSVAFWVCAAVYLTCGILQMTSGKANRKIERDESKPVESAFIAT